MNPELELSIADARTERPVTGRECYRCDRKLAHDGAHVVFAKKRTVAWFD